MSIKSLIHHILEPHCPDCHSQAIEEREESKTCSSCETLIRQLEIANHEKQLLLDRLLKEPTVELPKSLPDKYDPPRQIPWAVRRQMLEAEDRRRAQIMKQAPQPDVRELERELGVDNVENKETESYDTKAQD